MSEQRTEISSLGEFGLINHLTRDNETTQAGTLVSVGDDAAVIDQFGVMRKGDTDTTDGDSMSEVDRTVDGVDDPLVR